MRKLHLAMVLCVVGCNGAGKSGPQAATSAVAVVSSANLAVCLAGHDEAFIWDENAFGRNCDSDADCVAAVPLCLSNGENMVCLQCDDDAENQWDAQCRPLYRNRDQCGNLTGFQCCGGGSCMTSGNMCNNNGICETNCDEKVPYDDSGCADCCLVPGQPCHVMRLADDSFRDNGQCCAATECKGPYYLMGPEGYFGVCG
jgi:hypothetical protein